MKYEGYKIGPVIRDIRKDKGLLIEEVAAKTGISVSTLGQVEQGGRNLSMKNLYMLMEVYETDANSLLAIDCTPDSLDSRLAVILHGIQHLLYSSSTIHSRTLGAL